MLSWRFSTSFQTNKGEAILTSWLVFLMHRKKKKSLDFAAQNYVSFGWNLDSSPYSFIYLSHICDYSFWMCVSDCCVWACMCIQKWLVHVCMRMWAWNWTWASLCSGVCDKEITLKSLQVSLCLLLRCFITTNTVLQEPSGDSTIQSYGPYTHIWSWTLQVSLNVQFYYHRKQTTKSKNKNWKMGGATELHIGQ